MTSKRSSHLSFPACTTYLKPRHTKLTTSCLHCYLWWQLHYTQKLNVALVNNHFWSFEVNTLNAIFKSQGLSKYVYFKKCRIPESNHSIGTNPSKFIMDMRQDNYLVYQPGKKVLTLNHSWNLHKTWVPFSSHF